ncbi:heterokaryon incompatibility protein-domain-containing protein [Lasiosphaeria hispida]|uniref:Heterokaryon incompatibility protein-domain-containing protein n=1 Tax=Lasiosphaeria hispida TaxID=260671 RepID=A0AAJ0H5R9_9PEZI|nr:heterokaryon incompatibility protein-domain-containing protein [Lasiosphaeria hispida]
MESLYRDIQLPSSDEGPHFRLLTLLPSKSSDAAIRFSLSVSALSDETVEYEALSYCWGDAVHNRVTTVCNGVTFTVGENLGAALLRLRLPEAPRTLWIDAVCINQDDLAERAQQVGYMRDIYRHSKGVLIWLGTEYDDSGLVFPLCERIAKAFARSANSGNESLAGEVKEDWAQDALTDSQLRMKDRWEEGETDKATEDFLKAARSDAEIPTGVVITSFGGTRIAHARIDEFQAFMKLLQRPWWKRSWIIQEICLAAEATIICGDSTLEWHIFIVSILLLLLEAADRQLLPTAVRGNALSMIRIRSWIQHPGPDTNLNLLELLWEFRSQEATDARDKIYAFLGLVPPTDPVHSQIRVDYQVDNDVKKCYTEAALAFLSLRQNLDLLSTGRYPSHGETSLPSWVPDWSFSPPTQPTLLPLQVFTPSSPKTGIPFSASGPNTTYTLSSSLTPPTTHLPLKGFILDRLATIAPPLPPIFTVEYDSFMLTPSLPRLKTTTAFLRSVGHHLDILLRWESLATSITPYPGTSDPDPLRVLTAVLCAGNTPRGLDAAHGAFMKHRAELKWPRRVARWRGRLGVGERVYRPLLGAAKMVSRGAEYGPEEDEAFFTHMAVATGRGLGRTEGGLLGLVPPGAREGDGVVLCEGGKVPLVVREGEGGWELLGGGYFHGVMFGERWEAGRCGSITVV